MQALTLKYGRLWAARWRFNQHLGHAGRKCQLTFDQLLALMADEEASMSEIARRAGVTRSRIYELYHIYFEEK